MKTKTVYLAVEVPAYGIRNSLLCADQLLDLIEKAKPPVNTTARRQEYTVKSVRVA